MYMGDVKKLRNARKEDKKDIVYTESSVSLVSKGKKSKYFDFFRKFILFLLSTNFTTRTSAQTSLCSLFKNQKAYNAPLCLLIPKKSADFFGEEKQWSKCSFSDS